MTCEKLLIQLAHSVKWLGYLSSTGVYGDYSGAWVSEDSPTLAAAGRPLARLKAEQAWTALHQQHGLPVHVFRLGGASACQRSDLAAPAERLPLQLSEAVHSR